MKFRRFLIIGLILVGLLAWPSTARQGVNYDVQARQLPLGLKTFQFIQRHWEYQRLVKQIIQETESNSNQIQAIASWTQEHIRPTQSGEKILDDHVLNIVLRGHGAPDQLADVFTTLCTYRGLPAFWRIVQLEQDPAALVLSYVQTEGEWTVWDVQQALGLRDPQGNLLSVSLLQSKPELAKESLGSKRHRGYRYTDYVQKGLEQFEVPPMLRARRQMPLPRIAYELRRLGNRATGFLSGRSIARVEG